MAKDKGATLVAGPETKALWQIMEGHKTIDFASVATGTFLTTTVTVKGAAVGDVCIGVSLSAPTGFTAGFIVFGGVTATDTVAVTVYNATGANPTDLASGTLTAVVLKVRDI